MTRKFTVEHALRIAAESERDRYGVLDLPIKN
jgi:hypothetical protein